MIRPASTTGWQVVVSPPGRLALHVNTPPGIPAPEYPWEYLAPAAPVTRHALFAPNGRQLLHCQGVVALDVIRNTQAGLRHTPAETNVLADAIRSTGSLPAPITLAVCIDDGQIFVRDGHHTLAALVLLGRRQLCNLGLRQEFVLETYTYAEFDQINFRYDAHGALDVKTSWLTPFDPRQHVRHAQLRGYKQYIKHLANIGLAPQDLRQIIRSHPELYRASRAEELPHIPSERDWTNYLQRMRASMGPKIAQLITLIPNRGVLVDVGCGSGDQSAYYAARYPDLMVIGMDAAPQALVHSRSRFGNRDNLLFMRGNACQAIAPAGSARAVIDSSTAHEIFSFSDFDRGALVRYFTAVHEALATGGTYGSRDFTAPHWPSTVRIRLPTAPESGTGPYGALSRADLFRTYACQLRTGDFPEGVAYREIASADPAWAVFELDATAAANFVLRMEYRTNWNAELAEQYIYWTMAERIAALQAAGLRVDYAGEVHNVWIYLHWWKQRLHVTDTAGQPLDLPPTNGLVYAMKPRAADPVSLTIVAAHPNSTGTPWRLTTHRHTADPTCVMDLIEMPEPTTYTIPFTKTADGSLILHLRRQHERPALAYYAAHTGLYHVYYSGYDPGGLTRATPVPAEWRANTAAPLPVYFASPGLSNEVVQSTLLDVTAMAPLVVQDESLQAIELRQLLASAHVGSIPDPHLELAAYTLAAQHQLPLDDWFDGELPMDTQAMAGLATASTYRALVDKTAEPAPFVSHHAPANFGAVLTLDLQRTFTDRTEATHATLFVPQRHALDTQVVVPYVLHDGTVYVGFETRALPALQQQTGNAQVAVMPAWRMGKGLTDRTSANRFLRDRLQTDFGVHSRHVTPLGEGYFPSPDTTPEKVAPFAVEVNASHPPRDLTFLPLAQALHEIDAIPDLHTKIALYRLAHALGILDATFFAGGR